MQLAFGASERKACRLLKFWRGSHRYVAHPKDDRFLRMKIREIAQKRPRYGYSRIHVLLRREGWLVNRKRVYRIYREEGLCVQKQKRKKLSVVLRTEPPKAQALNEVWAMDFVHDQLFSGRKIRALTIVDKYSRESPHIEVDFSLNGERVVKALNYVKSRRGLPKVITVDNGSEFVSKVLDYWSHLNVVQLQFILPGKPV